MNVNKMPHKMKNQKNKIKYELDLCDIVFINGGY